MKAPEYMTLIISERVFVSEDELERLAVVQAIDADGNECSLEEAVWCVAGPDKDGLYTQIDMTRGPTSN